MNARGGGKQQSKKEKNYLYITDKNGIFGTIIVIYSTLPELSVQINFFHRIPSIFGTKNINGSDPNRKQPITKV
jgi:hypothetical protein